MIDTSTTAGKIEVQQAHVDGKKVSYKSKIGFNTCNLPTDIEPEWDWPKYDYYIRPQTLEEAANEFAQNNLAMIYSKNTSNIAFIGGVKWGRKNPEVQG